MEGMLILRTNRAWCSLNKKILNLLNKESISSYPLLQELPSNACGKTLVVFLVMQFPFVLF